MELGRYTSKAVSKKDLKELVMASLTDKGASSSTFSFVPATGILPSQVLVEKDRLPKIMIGQEGTMAKTPAEYERNLEIKTLEPSENSVGEFHKQRSGDNFSKDLAALNKLEEIKHNDLFIAEFVVVMDSGDGEDEKITKKRKEAKDYGSIRAQRSTITQTKAALPEKNDNDIADPEAQQEFIHDMSHQELQQHFYLPTADGNSNRLHLTNLSQSSQGISNYKECRNPSVPVNINKKTEDINTFSKPFLSQELNSFRVSNPNAHLPNPLSSLSNSQMQRQNSAPDKSERSKAMSPLPIKVIKHPLCRSPSPLGSQLFGSSSTICSVNDSQSPVPRPETTSRLSYLTSLLKSKKSAYERTISPEQNQYHSGVKSSFLKTARTSSPPRKSQSCFALNYSKHFNISNVPRKNEGLKLTSASDILHGEYAFPLRSLQSPSPESVPFKSSSDSFFSQKRVVSPLMELAQQPNKLLSSSRENVPPLNEKPPLNRQANTPLKKYSVLGKSKRVTLFPPPVHFHQSLSNAISQKQNVTPYGKRQVPIKSNLRPSFSLGDNLHLNRARSTSPMEITESRFPPSYPNIYQPSNENIALDFNVSPSLLSCYTNYFKSSEEMPRNYTQISTSPTNILGSSRSSLFGHRELRSTSSLSHTYDQENKQSYKIKSSYKSFAAIPTNTLLRDQKANEKPEIDITTASNENMDPHHEMCSPALLRQQTEEICAAIDEVLNDDPLPMHHTGVLKPAIRKSDPKAASILKSPPKSAGRETKYASIQNLANTGRHNLQKTRPGVIRPMSLKINALETMDGPISPFDFQQFSMP